MVSPSPLVWLHDKYKDRDWFHSVGEDEFGRYVVYVKFMNHETLHDVPDVMGGIQVLVHFAASKFASADQFMTKPNITVDPMMVLEGAARRADADSPKDEVDEMTNSDEEKSLRHLQNELDKLERACGSNTLQDIFYEAHDFKLTGGRDTVTDWSSKYPEVREKMDRLYKLYGFDVIYEELDG